MREDRITTYASTLQLRFLPPQPWSCYYYRNLLGFWILSCLAQSSGHMCPDFTRIYFINSEAEWNTGFGLALFRTPLPFQVHNFCNMLWRGNNNSFTPWTFCCCSWWLKDILLSSFIYLFIFSQPFSCSLVRLYIRIGADSSAAVYGVPLRQLENTLHPRGALLKGTRQGRVRWGANGCGNISEMPPEATL